MDYLKLADGCVRWIKEWFDANGPQCRAVLGMSGGKDSTVAAARCARALGPSRVTGVAIPSNGQGVNEADQICRFLGIEYLCIPIGEVDSAMEALGVHLPAGAFSAQSILNIPRASE